MKYSKYPSYKDSGVEWLGDVPEHWELWKMAHAFKTIGSGTTPSSTDNSYYNGSFPWVTTGELRENIITSTKKMLTKKALLHNSSLTLFPKDSILIAMYGATIGRLGKLGIDATTNQACCVMTNSKVIINNYLYYWLMGYKNEIINLAYGGGQPNISQDTISNLKVSAPDIQEQQIIANYLDKATDKIDTLISKQTKLIELLREKRQAVISRAVTRGLEAKVAMKDSGVEWLGEIPEHWEAKKLKYSARIQGGKDQKEVIDDNGKYPVYGSGGIFGYANQYLYNGKSVLLGRKGTIDKPLYVEGKFWTVDTMYYTILEKTTIAKWLYYSATTIKFDYYQYGSAVPSMTQEDLHNIYFSTPLLKEQQSIANYLDDKTSKIDSLITKSTKAIDLLKEKRQALISAVVTGKMDVRGEL